MLKIAKRGGDDIYPLTSFINTTTSPPVSPSPCKERGRI